jgi:hypothetical protein
MKARRLALNACKEDLSLSLSTCYMALKRLKEVVAIIFAFFVIVRWKV